MTDSLLVKRIKKFERLAKKASQFDKRNETAFGDADLTIDGIFEIVHEANIRIDEKLKKEKEAEDEEK